MTYTYKTKGTCSTQIDLELEGNIVHNVKFTGGCNGNLQAIPKLVEGLTVEQVEEKIGGIILQKLQDVHCFAKHSSRHSISFQTVE